MSFAVLTTIADMVRRQWGEGDPWKMLLPCWRVRPSQTLTLGGTWKRLSPQSGRFRASQENPVRHLHIRRVAARCIYRGTATRTNRRFAAPRACQDVDP